MYARREITNRKKFSKEEAFAAGMMPLVVIPNPCWDELKVYMMKKLGYTEEKRIAVWHICGLLLKRKKIQCLLLLQ